MFLNRGIFFLGQGCLYLLSRLPSRYQGTPETNDGNPRATCTHEEGGGQPWGNISPWKVLLHSRKHLPGIWGHLGISECLHLNRWLKKAEAYDKHMEMCGYEKAVALILKEGDLLCFLIFFPEAEIWPPL